MDYEPKTAFEGIVLSKLEELKSNLCNMDERLSSRIDATKAELGKINGRLRGNESEVAVLKSELSGIKGKSIGAGGLSGGAIAAIVEVVKGLIWGK